MKTCNGCALAEWQRTTSGRLHPSRVGRCTWTMPVPNSYNAWYSRESTLSGGHIVRNYTYQQDCPYYTEEQTQ
jgi:hypothetical protein